MTLFELLFPAITTFGISLFLCFSVLYFFPKWKILDRPERYGHKRKPIPYPGGIAPVIALLLGMLVFFPFDAKFITLEICLALIAVISFWDDRSGLSPILRLIVQIGCGIALSLSGIAIFYLGNPFGEAFILTDIFSFLPHIITMIWIVGFANVMNWTDGVPGLSAASAAVASAFLGFLSLSETVNQPEIAALAFCFSGATLAFVLFNIPPPKMLLGDTGSMTFGFFLAALTVFSGGKMATAFIVLLLPMLDAAWVILSRIREGKNPLKGNDGKHLHDRLKAVGISDRLILLLFLIPSLLLGWFSLQLETTGKILLILGVSIIFFCFAAFLERIAAKFKTL